MTVIMEETAALMARMAVGEDTLGELRRRLTRPCDDAEALQEEAQDVKAEIGDLVDELSDLKDELPDDGEQRKAVLLSASRAELEAGLAALDQTDAA